MKTLWSILLFLMMALAGCLAQRNPTNHSDAFSPPDKVAVETSVRQFMGNVAQQVTNEGPTAWGRVFQGSPNFFMAVDGSVEFPTGEAAAQAIPGLAQIIKRIELHWQPDLRVDPLASNLAIVGASWDETITDNQAQQIKHAGYFTAVVERQNGQWQFRDVHWSTARSSSLPE